MAYSTCFKGTRMLHLRIKMNYNHFRSINIVLNSLLILYIHHWIKINSLMGLKKIIMGLIQA